MSSTVRRVIVAIGIPVVIAIILKADPRWMRENPLPVATFALFWALFWFRGVLVRGTNVDTGTYGGVLLGVMPMVTGIGVVWGLLGLALAAWFGAGGRDLAGGRLYLAVGILILLAAVGLPAVFSKRPMMMHPPGPVEDDRPPMTTHPKIVLPVAPGREQKGGNRPEAPGEEREA